MHSHWFHLLLIWIFKRKLICIRLDFVLNNNVIIIMIVQVNLLSLENQLQEIDLNLHTDQNYYSVHSVGGKHNTRNSCFCD